MLLQDKCTKEQDFGQSLTRWGGGIIGCMEGVNKNINYLGGIFHGGLTPSPPRPPSVENN